VNEPVSPGTDPVPITLTLVCFAVGTEAAPFRRRQPSGTQVVVTGMGAANALRGIAAAVDRHRPGRVVTCGFAGGLVPGVPRGTVLFDLDDDGASDAGPMRGWAGRLRAVGARSGRIHCAARVAVTLEDKRRLHAQTGADAVEMESGVIRAFCRERGIPSATVRVVSDAADEPLPVDFNGLLTADHRLHPGRLLATIVRSPRVIGGLLRLGRHTREAAVRLADVLVAVLAEENR
jgi:adenosylhomocysteine nucleosidase